MEGYCWCPGCMKWVPEQLMNRERDLETRQLIRICTPCLEGVSATNSYVFDEHHEQTRCVYCRSYNTTELVSQQYNKFFCNNCRREFFRV
nr:MAG TPA: NUDIX domain protein [Caudoviricetes sp.]